LSKSNKQKGVVLLLWQLPGANNPTQQKESLYNSTKDLELGCILLEISNNRKLVVMMTALWKSRILCRSGWLKFRQLMRADISFSVSFLPSRWSRTGLKSRRVRIIFGHLERIYYWMATIWALDRTSKPCNSLKQKLAEYTVGIYDIHICTLIVKIQGNTNECIILQYKVYVYN